MSGLFGSDEDVINLQMQQAEAARQEQERQSLRQAELEQIRWQQEQAMAETRRMQEEAERLRQEQATREEAMAQEKLLALQEKERKAQEKLAAQKAAMATAKPDILPFKLTQASLAALPGYGQASNLQRVQQGFGQVQPTPVPGAFNTYQTGGRRFVA